MPRDTGYEASWINPRTIDLRYFRDAADLCTSDLPTSCCPSLTAFRVAADLDTKLKDAPWLPKAMIAARRSLADQVVKAIEADRLALIAEAEEIEAVKSRNLRSYDFEIKKLELRHDKARMGREKWLTFLKREGIPLPRVCISFTGECRSSNGHRIMNGKLSVGNSLTPDYVIYAHGNLVREIEERATGCLVLPVIPLPRRLRRATTGDRYYT